MKRKSNRVEQKKWKRNLDEIRKQLVEALCDNKQTKLIVAVDMEKTADKIINLDAEEKAATMGENM